MIKAQEIILQNIQDNRSLYNSMNINMNKLKHNLAIKILEVNSQKEALELARYINNMIADFEFMDKLQTEHKKLKEEFKECSIS